MTNAYLHTKILIPILVNNEHYLYISDPRLHMYLIDIEPGNIDLYTMSNSILYKGNN